MRTAPALLIVLAFSVALTGCVPDDDPLVIDPSPSVTPIFESDEEALAAAEAALSEYYSVSDQILRDGGIGTGALLEVATEEVVQTEQTGHDRIKELGWKAVGATSLDTISLQVYDVGARRDEDLITIYVCVDISNFDLVDSSGNSVVDSSRDNRLPFEVAFTFATDSASELIVSRKDSWTGEDFCG